MKKILILILLISSLTRSQTYSPGDVKICNAKFELAESKNLMNEPVGDIIAVIGRSFLGTEYAAHTLDKGNKEQLVIDLSGLDCTTFLETSLSFARCIKENKTSFTDFEKQLTRIRYRGGIIKNFPSRLNYFSDWIYDNVKKGIIKNVSKDLGGVPVRFNVDFMSAHPDAYIQLKENPSYIPEIKLQEKEISQRIYYYIPKEKIAACQNKIENGDLIAFTTDIKGLDITHVGIAVKMKNGSIHLLHAPNVGYKVQITDYSLPVYISKIKKDTGIIVLRAVY